MSDVDLKSVLQQLVQETIKGLKLSDMVTGVVESVSPLAVKPDISEPSIEEPGLILTSAVKERIVQVQGGDGGTVRVNEGLAVGDKVLMLRVSGAQRHIILSRL